MPVEEILNYCAENFDGVVIDKNWGERGVFYNPDGALKKGVYILTIKEKDGDNDRASNLDRQGVYRVNLGLRKETFLKMFSFVPKRPPAGGIVEMSFNFSRTDEIMPHPVYAWMSWICVLSPTERTLEALKPLIEEAYLYAKEKYGKRKK